MNIKNPFILCMALSGCQLMYAQATSNNDAFNPSIKVSSLIQARFESSLTDSVDVQNKFNADAVMANFRLRRLELRTDIILTPNLKGVIRVQLPELKGTAIGKVIELGYMEYKVKDGFQIRAGQFKDPYELDELTEHSDLRMIDRGTTSKMIVDNNLASYQPGIMVFGKLWPAKKAFNYYIAAVNGSNRAVPYDDNSQKNIIGRLEFYPIKQLRVGANAEYVALNDVTANSFGADIQLIQKLSDKTKLILEGEYIQAPNLLDYVADTSAEKNIADFNLSGYFAQALFKININKKWCNTFEAGGKYENTDPRDFIDMNAFSTITGDIAFTFLPDNDARLQLNIIHTTWQSKLSGSANITASNLFVAQMQLKF